jgi:hypothetical protein
MLVLEVVCVLVAVLDVVDVVEVVEVVEVVAVVELDVEVEVVLLVVVLLVKWSATLTVIDALLPSENRATAGPAQIPAATSVAIMIFVRAISGLCQAVAVMTPRMYPSCAIDHGSQGNSQCHANFPALETSSV